MSREARDEALAIRCRVVRAPGLEGLCDGRSLRALLATVKPRALVAPPGPDGGAAAAALAAFARERLAPRGGVAHGDAGRRRRRGPRRLARPRAAGDARLSWRVLQAQAAGAVTLGDGYDVCRVRCVLVDADGDPPPAPSSRRAAHAPPAAGPRPPRLWLSARDVVLPALKARLAAGASRRPSAPGRSSAACRRPQTVDDRGAGRIVVDGPLCYCYHRVPHRPRRSARLSPPFMPPRGRRHVRRPGLGWH